MGGEAGEGAAGRMRASPAPLRIAGVTVVQDLRRPRSSARGAGWAAAAIAIGTVLATVHLELVLLLVAGRVAYELHRARHRRPGVVGALRGVGLGLLWGVGLVVLVTQISGAGVRLSGALDDLAGRVRNRSPTIDTIVGPVPGDLELAARYQPLLVFSRGERWHPTTVDRYVADAVLEDPTRRVLDGDPTIAGLSTVRRCPGPGGSSCHRLTIRCPGPRASCAADERGQQPAAYLHVVHLPPPGRPTPVGPVDTVIQYWFFYRFDDWRARAGVVEQWHEADWEAATIGFSGGRPRFAAYTEHCGGEWRPWRRLVGGLPRSGGSGALGWIPQALPLQRLREGVVRSSHPVAYVARGSHAMYIDARPRVPSWAQCSDFRFAGEVLGPSYASGLREAVDAPRRGNRVPAADAAAQLPPLIDPLAGLSVMRYQGVWGGGDRTRAFGRALKIGRGPVTPSVTALWQDPLGVIFCAPHWRPEGHCRK